MEQLFVVEEILCDYAVCEDGDKNRVNIPLELLPAGTKPGSCVVRGEDGKFQADFTEEAARRKRVAELSKKLFED